MITTEFFNCIFFLCSFFMLYFSNDLFIYFYWRFYFLLSLSPTVLLTLPSLHIISWIADHISTRWTMRWGCFFLVKCSLWNVSLLNCTKGYYMGRSYLHIKHVPLLSDVKGQMICHRFFLLSVPIVTKIENLIKKNKHQNSHKKEV